MPLKNISRTIIFLLGIFLSCSNPVEFDKDTISIRFETGSQPAVNADGYSTVPIFVTLETTVINDANRVIALSTGAGTFVLAGTNNAITEFTAVPGVAYKINVIAGKTAGDFEVRASIKLVPEYFATIPIKLSALTADKVIDVALTTSDITKVAGKYNGDGQDVIKGDITIQNSKETSVTITTTEATGKFMDTGTTTTTLKVNQDNKIPFLLKPGMVPGTYFITVRLGENAFAVTRQYIVLPVASDQMIAIMIDGTKTYTANGEDVVVGKVRSVPSGIVTLSTTGGTFLSATPGPSFDVPIGANGEGTFLLRTGTTVSDGTNSIQYFIEAKLKSTTFSITKELTINTAYPEDIIIDPTSFSIKGTNGTLDIKVLLTRTSGKVSDGVRVNFYAYQLSDTTKEIGRFKEAIPAYSRNQIVNVKFSTDTRQPSDLSKPIIVKVSYKKSNEKTTFKKFELKAEP